MPQRIHTLLRVVFTVSAIAAASVASRGGGIFKFTDLTDISAGKDLWQADYSLDPYSFPANGGFTVFFDAFFQDLHIAGGLTPGWSTLVFPFDPVLKSDGGFDAQALSAAPAYNGPFSLTFVWTGGLPPGSQRFEYYDTSFNILNSGFTVPAVPPVSAVSDSPSMITLSVMSAVFCAFCCRMSVSKRK